MVYYSGQPGADAAGKEDSAREAPNPSAGEMIAHLDESGVETVFDRLDAQSPQCRSGLRGLCCRMCQMGPCRISAKSPRGVCGRTMEAVVMANLVRAVAAGTSAQTMHARELILALRAVALGKMTLSVKGKDRLRDAGSALNVASSWDSPEEVAEKVASALLNDLSRMDKGRTRSMGFSPRERRKLWDDLGVTPRSAALEVVESLHMTSMGGCSDWEALFLQAVRTSLAYAYTGLVSASVLTDILFGVPEPRVAEANYGILKPDHVNILVHGHSAVLLEKVLEKIATEEIQALAREYGAEGIVLGGMCCTGHEMLARHGVPAVTGAMGQELAVGTGAVDAVVVDMQCVLPGMQAVAECFGTEIITTCESNRIPGATHIPFDPEHPGSLDEDAMRVAHVAVEAFSKRDRTQIHIPEGTTTVTTGFTRESIMKSFGHARKLVARMQGGDIRGIVAMVGCTNPKIAYETGHVTIARELVRNGVLVLTSGCASHALLNSGLCSSDATHSAPAGFQAACQEAGIPPVLAMGSCSDNARIIQVFAQLAHEAEIPLADMPFVLSGPEFTHEKPVGQMVAVLAHGITTVVGFSPQLPIPAVGLTAEAKDENASANHNPMADFFCGEGLASLLGARLLVQPDPERGARVILGVLDQKREALAEWSRVLGSEEAASVAPS